MPTTCHAAVFVEPNKPLVIQEFPVPPLEPGATLVRMEMAAICGSDVHASHHPGTPRPLIFGHENIGSIAEMNGGPTHDVLSQPLHVGDRVIFRPAPCGRCLACSLDERCTASETYGMRRSDIPPHLYGGFGQYLYLDPNPWILRVPDDMTTERALLSVIGNHTVANAIERIGGVTPGEVVVVQGAGPIGMGGLIQSKLGGASRVIVIGAPLSRLALASELGADETIDLADYPEPRDRVDRVKQLTGGLLADIVLECSGGPTAVQEGLEMTRHGGRYSVIGQWTDYGPMPINPALVTRKALRIGGVVAATSRSIIRSMQTMHRVVQLPVEKLITHYFPLERINDGFRAHEALEAMIAVVQPNA